MTLGAVAFLNPWLLAGLIALPAIWWLLRTVPPRPRRIEFPPTRILVNIENKEKTPDKSPWWLTLIRILAAAAVILALADPVLNPDKGADLNGNGPLVLVIDNGWASAAHWPAHRARMDRLIDEAERDGRAVLVVPTASMAKSPALKLGSAVDARSKAATIQPMPFAPVRSRAVHAIRSAVKGRSGIGIVWLNDGVDHDGTAGKFMKDLIAIANGGSVLVVATIDGEEALGVVAGLGENGALVAKVHRAAGNARQGILYAFTARGQRLAKKHFDLASGARNTSIKFKIPLELRNQITRIEIAGERSAGAVSLLDARSRWHRVGLVSGESREEAQPLLAPLYYIKRALKPFAELAQSPDSNIAEGIAHAFRLNASILMLADIGTITGELANNVRDWVRKGGILVRFAGPRLEKGGDDLLPAALRVGGRSLGGALSWSTPQPLAPFRDDTPFAGLAIPNDVVVNRQVLADPAHLGRDVKVWARLKDGTPLVTARRLGDGEIVLFHVTANSDWSNLPLSGLFVNMLKRITARGRLGGLTAGAGEGVSETRTGEDKTGASGRNEKNQIRQKILAPVQILSGFGILKPPPPTAEAISATKLLKTRPSALHPPGYYGSSAVPRALNVLTDKSKLLPLPAPPAGARIHVMEATQTTPLKPWLLAGALMLIFADIIAVLVLQGGGRLFGRPRKQQAGTSARQTMTGRLRKAAKGTMGKAAALLLAVGLGAATAPPFSYAQSAGADVRTGAVKNLNEQFVLRATSRVTFGYVLTGDERTDRVSREGLNGLSRNLRRRTSVEPGDPAGVNIVKDDIALFPILYWPVMSDARALSDRTLAKIDAYMKQGGMIIFDTKDFGQGIPTGFSLSRRGASPLQRLLGKLDIPRLEPVPQGHVLTKSFYLLRRFPGRWSGGELWVEADAGGSTDGSRQARRADGVSSILVTSNDLAAAWAIDADGRPLYPTVPGGLRQREMAIRTGINIVMYALTGNYKADQVHIPALLERLGQ